MAVGPFRGRQVFRSARQAQVAAGALDAAECMTRHHHGDFSKSLKNHRTMLPGGRHRRRNPPGIQPCGCSIASIASSSTTRSLASRRAPPLLWRWRWASFSRPPARRPRVSPRRRPLPAPPIRPGCTSRGRWRTASPSTRSTPWSRTARATSGRRPSTVGALRRGSIHGLQYRQLGRSPERPDHHAERGAGRIPLARHRAARAR